MTKRILITGAGGAIGCHAVGLILDQTDWNVIAVDSFRHKGHFDRVTEIAKTRNNSRVNVFTHDLTAPFTQREIDKIGHVDYILNLASLSDVQDSIDDPVPFIKNNVDLVINMLEYARIAKPDSFIQFSTDEVYGPASEHGDGHPEWDEILPSNPYAASKAAQEAIAISYWRSYGVPVIITNTMNNFGQMQSGSKFPTLVQKALEDGTTVDIHATADGKIGTRYYLHSRHAMEAVLYILQNLPATLHAPGEIDRPDRYNIVGDKQVSNLELAETIADIMGLELNYQLKPFHEHNPGHDLHYGLTNTKLAELGWEPSGDFRESLEETIEWQIDHPEWIRA